MQLNQTDQKSACHQKRDYWLSNCSKHIVILRVHPCVFEVLTTVQHFIWFAEVIHIQLEKMMKMFKGVRWWRGYGTVPHSWDGWKYIRKNYDRLDPSSLEKFGTKNIHPLYSQPESKSSFCLSVFQSARLLIDCLSTWLRISIGNRFGAWTFYVVSGWQPTRLVKMWRIGLFSIRRH